MNIFGRFLPLLRPAIVDIARGLTAILDIEQDAM